MTSPTAFVDLRFSYSEDDRTSFRAGILSRDWAQQYPSVFDDDDLRLATGLQRKTNHFFEWLAAVHLYELTGYLSLVEKYDCRNHPRKHSLFRTIVGPTVFANVMSNPQGIPDLVVYSPDHADWLFAEVKGSTDRLKDYQRSRIHELAALTGRSVLVLNYSARMPRPTSHTVTMD